MTFKFMPELVSIEELDLLADSYRQRVKQINGVLRFLEVGSDGYNKLYAEKRDLLRRKWHIQSCIKHRTQN